MKASEKETLIAFFGKTLNLTAEDVAPIFEKKGDEEELKPDALKTLLAHDATRIKALKDEVATVETESFNKGYKKAQGEALTKWEKEIKEANGIKSDKKGLELITEIVKAKAEPGTLDADKIKTHPDYLKMEKELNDKIELTKTEWESKYNKRETELSAEKTFSTIMDKANKTLEALKPVLPKDSEKAKNQKQLLINELKGLTYEEKNGELIILKSDGKRLEDAHGKPVKFEDLVKDTAAKYWDFESGEGRNGSGADNNVGGTKVGNVIKTTADGSTTVKWGGQVPKNDAEYEAAFKTTTNAEERMALLDAYEAASKAN